MTLRVWPSAVALDSDARTLPAPLVATLASAGLGAPIMLLVAGREAVATGWAPRAAVALAEGWCRAGKPVVLADLGIGAPSLDALVGEANEEGLADVFLFGASLGRVIRTSPDRCFGFVPTGESPADSHDVLTDAGWRHVVAHFFRSGETLLAYIPAEAAGLEALALRLGAVVALATSADLEEMERTLPDEAGVLAVLEPPEVAEPPAPPSVAANQPEGVENAAAAPAERPPAEESRPEGPPTWGAPPPAVSHTEAVEEGPAAPVTATHRLPPQGGPREAEDARRRPAAADAARDARVDALWARREEAHGREKAPPVDVVPGRRPTAQERLREPLVLVRKKEPRPRWLSLLLWLIAGVVVGLVILFAILVYLGRTAEVTPRPSDGPPPAGALAPRTNPEAAAHAAVSDSLPYSVAIEAYPQYAPAVERAAQLAREQDGVAFFVTPTRDRGSVYYHVMAGPVPDSVGAAALMQRLLDAGVKTGASQWDIVPTRLAYTLGDYASRAYAETRAVELAQERIPAYVVEVPVGGEPSRWRVYAGAFQGAADASVLRPLLRNAGLPDSLVPRIGIAPR